MQSVHLYQKLENYYISEVKYFFKLYKNSLLTILKAFIRVATKPEKKLGIFNKQQYKTWNFKQSLHNKVVQLRLDTKIYHILKYFCCHQKYFIYLLNNIQKYLK